MALFSQIAHAGMIADATPVTVVLHNAFSTLLTIAGSISIISGLIAGFIFLYAAHSGSEELRSTAKKAIAWSIIGTIIILGSMIVMSTLSKIINGSING